MSMMAVLGSNVCYVVGAEVLMSMMVVEPKDYSDGRTKQAFKDSTDINKILAKAQKVGSLSHLVRHGAMYGDFSDVPDLLEAKSRIERGQKIFDDLPSEVRREFANDQFAFFTFVNDPANADRLREVLPALAARGRQMPAVIRTVATELPGLPAAPAAAVASTAAVPPA